MNKASTEAVLVCLCVAVCQKYAIDLQQTWCLDLDAQKGHLIYDFVQFGTDLDNTVYWRMCACSAECHSCLFDSNIKLKYT